MPLFVPKKAEGKDWLSIMDENQTQLDAIDTEAKEKGDLLWRYITEPFADGQAIYQIIKVNKHTVRIRVCTGLGDDWMIPYWGDETTIDLDYAEMKVAHRDSIAEFFAERKVN